MPVGRNELFRVASASLLHAAMMLAAFPPFGLWWLIFLAPAPLVRAAMSPLRFRWTATLLFLPMVGTWLVHQWWVSAVSGAGLVPMAAYLAAWTPLIAGVIRRIARSPRFDAWPFVFIVPIAWTGIEFLRATIVFEGYPWYLLGQPLVEWLPLAQVADLGGVTILAILPAVTGGLAADLLVHRSGGGGRRIPITFAIAVFVAWSIYGQSRLRSPGTGRSGPSILAIQTDLPQSNKVAWTPEQQWQDAVSFARGTIAAHTEATRDSRPVDLVAWPETMLPGVGLEPESTRVMIDAGWWPGDRFVELAEEMQGMLGVPLLLGSGSFEGLRVDGDAGQARLAWDRRFNSVYLLDGDGAAKASRYDKVFLTPFGERMPYISAWPWLERQLLDLGARGMSFDLNAGEEPSPLVFVGRGGDRISIGTPICFEDTVPAACRSLVWRDGEKVVDVLVNASNDGWFGSSMGPRSSHLQLARFRAIENRVPMVRVVNTGTTAWIDSCGRLRAVCPPLEPGWLVARTELDDRRTLFARIGQWPSAVFMVATMGLLASTIRLRSGSILQNP